jgi:polyphosphate kinase
VGIQVEAAEIVAMQDLSESDTAYLASYFRETVFPLLTPLAVDQGHPFPQVAHLAPNLAVVLRNRRHGQELFGYLGVPPSVPRLVALPEGGRSVPIEQVVAANLGRLFPGMQIVSYAVFLVIVQEARARAVRLEIDPGMRCDVRDLLIRRLRLANYDVHVATRPLDLVTPRGDPSDGSRAAGLRHGCPVAGEAGLRRQGEPQPHASGIGQGRLILRRSDSGPNGDTF